jgi:hypothetical protein
MLTAPPALTAAFATALITALLCAAPSAADARPRRLVVLDFDGPRQLADTGRSSVLSVLGEQYDVVATKRWEQARAAAAQHSHGPAQWSQAAKQSGVDAVIEGWVQDEGRRKILNVVVREANNGHEFDTVTVRFDGKHGLSSEGSRQLQVSLDEVLDWIDAGHSETAPAIPIVSARAQAVKSGADDDIAATGKRRTRRRPAASDAESDAALDRSNEAAGDAPPGKPASVSKSGDAPARPAVRSPIADGEAVPAAAVAPAAGSADPPGHDARPVEVSTADREVHEIEVLFPQASDERKLVLGARVDHAPQPTPRFMIDAGAYMGSRSLTWDADPDAVVTQFPGVSTKGLEINAAVYPFPLHHTDGILSGIGFTGSLHHSLGSTVIFDDVATVEEYVINQNGWELGGHYRMPLSDLVAIDGGVFYGNQTFEIVDASPDFEVPDTKYSYLGAGVRLDLAITERAQIGFGARYFTVLDSGDLASVDWFGPASATGLGLEASFVIPLPASLYVRGQLSYQRISLELSGGGQISDDEGVSHGTDSLIRGNVNLGIAF